MITRFHFRLAMAALAIAPGLALGGGKHSLVTAGDYQIDTNLGDPVTFVSYDGTQESAPFQMTIGYGSAAFHNPHDPAKVFYTASDRGPNIKCEDSGGAPVDIYPFCGMMDASGTFQPDDDGKIFPDPEFDPTIYKFTLVLGKFTMVPVVIQEIPLKDQDGNSIGGLSNDLPDRPKNLNEVTKDDESVPNTENGYSNEAQRLPFNQNSLDTEGLAQLPDGSFWVGEEYAPSIVHIDADGHVLERVVPNDSGVMNPITNKSMSVCDALSGTIDTALDTVPTNYPINCSLPDILDLRSLNRGIEDLTVSPDGKTLYFGMQSPLANPSKDAYKASRNVRIFTASLNRDGSFRKMTGEYVYVLDTPDTFVADNSSKQNDVKLSEMSMTPNGHLIQLERISKVTKLYHSDLEGATNILDSEWDDRETQPSLAEQTDLAAVGIVPVAKTLLFDTETDYPTAQEPGKVEGVAILSNKYFLLSNDNDFGIGGDPTELNVIRGAVHLFEN
ncbi:MAG: esterase-like activity of phytase family protein [Anaerolineae bacterium]